jgi:hypothetical protein
MKHDIQRKSTRKQASSPKKSRQENAFLQYNGGCREYEDPADYLPRISLKGVRIA